MADGTICPLLLLSNDNISSSDIDIKYLSLAKDHIDACRKQNIKLHISEKTWQRVLSLFPWNHIGNDLLRQRVAIWQAVVLTPLKRVCSFHKINYALDDQQMASIICSVTEDCELHKAWAEWLCFWASGPVINNQYIKGLATSSACCFHNNRSPLCNQFTLVFQFDDWKIVKYPWYKKYPINLPAEGDFPFCPPNNWENQQVIRGNNHGYIDREGNEWLWDRLHNDHWDVQLVRANDYKRISIDGRDIDIY